MDDKLTEELRQRLVESIRAKNTGDSYPAAPVWAPIEEERYRSDAELFAPVARQLRTFSARFGVLVPHTPSLRRQSGAQNLARCVRASTVRLFAPETGGWMTLRIFNDWTRGRRAIEGVYVSSIAPTDSQMWELVRAGQPVGAGPVDAAVEWFLGHIGEFVVQAEVPADFPRVAPAIAGNMANRENQLHQIFVASCRRSPSQTARYRAEMEADKATFSQIIGLLDGFGDAIGLRVEKCSAAPWKRTARLGEVALDRSIELQNWSSTKDQGRLFLGVKRPSHDLSQDRTPVLYGKRDDGPGTAVRSVKQWAIPDSSSPAFSVMLQEATEWFIGQMGPFVANPKRLKGVAAEGLGL